MALVKMKITRQEWLLVSIIALATVFLAMTPVFYGWLKTPEGKVLGALGRDDEYGYWHYLLQAKEGKWLFESYHILEAHPAIFTHLPYLIGGKVAGLTGWSISLVYNLSRIVYGLGLLLSLYFFISYFLADFRFRMISFLLVCFSSGLGWFWFFPNFLPSFHHHLAHANYVTEALTFPSIPFYPHFTFSLTLLIFCFYFFLRAYSENSIIFLILAGILGGLVIQSHPYYVVPIAIIPGVFLFFERKVSKKNWIDYFLFLLLLSLPIFYFLMAMKRSPAYQEWTQLSQASPPPFDVFLTYGLLFILAVWGSFKVFSGKKEPWLETEKLKFLVFWVATNFLLVKLPFSFQRRLIMGTHIPLSILGGLGIMEILGSEKKKFVVGLLLVLLTVPQNGYFLYNQIRQIRDNPSLYYLSNEKIESLLWFKANSDISEVILANPSMGVVIPGIAGRRVYLGSWSALRTEKKANWLSKFYDQKMTDEERIKFLLENSIDYLYFDKERIPYSIWVYQIEKQEGVRLVEKEKQFDPSDKDYLMLVFENEAASIYEIK